jgi:hypothetical protein
MKKFKSSLLFMNPIALVGAVTAGISLVKEVVGGVASVQKGLSVDQAPSVSFDKLLTKAVMPAHAVNENKLSAYMQLYGLDSKDKVADHIQQLWASLEADPMVADWMCHATGAVTLEQNSQGQYALVDERGQLLSLRNHPVLQEKAAWIVSLNYFLGENGSLIT